MGPFSISRPRPREVWVPPSLRRTLQGLFALTGGALALVSGRSLNDLDLLLAPLQLPAIGGHGAELRPFPGGASDPNRTPSLSADLKRKLATIAEIGPGILIEDKGYSLALHYRLAPEKGEAVWAAVADICAAAPPGTVEILPGKAVVEVKQKGFNKATAVVELMAVPPFAGRQPVFSATTPPMNRSFPSCRACTGSASRSDIAQSTQRMLRAARRCAGMARQHSREPRGQRLTGNTVA